MRPRLLLEPLRRSLAGPATSWCPGLEPALRGRPRVNGSGQLEFPWARSPSARIRRLWGWHAWWDATPAAVRRSLVRFRACGVARWRLLNLAARVPEGLELMDSSPGLAMAIASSDLLRRSAKPWRTARRLARMKRRDALGWLGFAGSRSSVRLVRRVPAWAASPWLLRRLRAASGDPGLRPLLAHHASTMHGGVFRLLTPRLRAHVGPSLVAQVSGAGAGADGRREGFVGMLLTDALDMALALGRPVPGAPFGSVAQVRAWHDDLVAQWQVHRAPRRRVLAGPFPPPPVPGNAWMVPLTSQQDLDEEGREMGHCVAVYGARVLRGWCYLFKVLGPHRATVEIRRSGPIRGAGAADRPTLRWNLVQIQGRHNSVVPMATRAVVERYLREAQAPVYGRGPDAYPWEAQPEGRCYGRGAGQGPLDAAPVEVRR